MRECKKLHDLFGHLGNLHTELPDELGQEEEDADEIRAKERDQKIIDELETSNYQDLEKNKVNVIDEESTKNI